jgi:transposase-like protein
MTTTAKGISANQASRKYDIQCNTAWLFMKKVRVSMKSTINYPLVDKVYVDEFVIGGHETGAVGRKTNSKKIKAVMAVEVTKQNRIKRLYSLEINNYSSEELNKMFEKHIRTGAVVHTDEWKGYIPLKSSYNIIQDRNTKTNSPVNRMIQQLKSWIRGTHHSINKYHASTYLDEFSFRINRSQWKDSIFHKCIERMVKNESSIRLQLSKVECLTRDQYVNKIKNFERFNMSYEVRGGKVKLVA